MAKCDYCNKKIKISHIAMCEESNKKINCCSDDCKAKALKFYQFGNKTKPLFLTGFIISSILMLVSVFPLILKELLMAEF